MENQKDKNWMKNNIISLLTFIFLVISLASTTIYNYSTVNSKIEEIKKVVDKREEDIEKQAALDKRVTILESNVANLSDRFLLADKSIKELSTLTNDVKTQSLMVNSTVSSLNSTLEKMNNTLDKLNETVIIVSKDVSTLKSEVEHLKDKNKGE